MQLKGRKAAAGSGEIGELDAVNEAVALRNEQFELARDYFKRVPN